MHIKTKDFSTSKGDFVEGNNVRFSMNCFIRCCLTEGGNLYKKGAMPWQITGMMEDIRGLLAWGM